MEGMVQGVRERWGFPGWGQALTACRDWVIGGAGLMVSRRRFNSLGPKAVSVTQGFVV